MIALPALAGLSSEPFCGDDAVNGVVAHPADGDGPGRVRVEVDGRHDVLAFYGAAPKDSRADPVIFLRGDALELREGRLVANEFYRATSPRDVQAPCEQFSALFGRPCLHLARPGILGSSGHHRDRRRPREVALVDAALSRLKSNRRSGGASLPEHWKHRRVAVNSPGAARRQLRTNLALR